MSRVIPALLRCSSLLLLVTGLSAQGPGGPGGTARQPRGAARTPWEAATRGDVDAVRAMLGERPALVRDTDGDQRTPLHLAARYGRLEVVRLLLDAGASPEQEAYNRFRPLHLAVMNGRREVVAELLERNAELEPGTSFGRTALQLAARGGRQEIVRMLLDAGARYDVFTAACRGDGARVATLLAENADPVPREVVEEAVRRGHADLVRALLPRMDRRRTPIPNAVFVPLLFQATAHADVVRVLVEAGRDVTRDMVSTGKTFIAPGSTVLHLAAARGHVDTLRYLLSLKPFAEGVDDWRDNTGRTAAHAAAAAGQIEALQALHAVGADPLAKDTGGRTTVHHAAKFGSVRVLRWLAGEGVVLGGTDHAGRDALFYATRSLHPTETRARDRIEAAWVLVRHGVTPGLADAVVIGDEARVFAVLGDEPVLAQNEELLTRAISFGRTAIVNALLDHGAKIDGVDAFGNTPLHWAALWSKADVARTLIEHGAAVNARQKNGRTPLHEAARAGAGQVVDVLLAAGADKGLKDDEGRRPVDHATHPSVAVVAAKLR